MAAAAGVILGEDVEGLAVPVLGHEVARALGDPVDEEDLHEGGQDLQQRDGPPGPVALHPRRAPAYPGDLRNRELGQIFAGGLEERDVPSVRLGSTGDHESVSGWSTAA